jgi:hypothetical protein
VHIYLQSSDASRQGRGPSNSICRAERERERGERPCSRKLSRPRQFAENTSVFFFLSLFSPSENSRRRMKDELADMANTNLATTNGRQLCKMATRNCKNGNQDER